MEEARFYTVDELAQRWRLAPETVRRMIRRRELRVLDIGGRAGYRIAESEVARFEREHTLERRVHD